MTNELNTEIERNTSFSIILEPDVNLTGYTFIYLVKNKPTDTDANAVIPNITPVLKTVNNIVELEIPFLPSDTKNLAIGYLYHSLRAISADTHTVITLFSGTLKITQNGIEAP